MAQLQAFSGAVFRDREFFVHDGRQLRHYRISASLQAFLFFVSAFLVGWSGFSATQIFLSPAADKIAISPYAAQLQKLAAETDRRVQLVEQRQFALAVALSDESVPEAARAGHPQIEFEQGLVHEVAARRMEGRYQNVRAYLAGPPPAVEAAIRVLLLKAKLTTDNIRYDKFS